MNAEPIKKKPPLWKRIALIAGIVLLVVGAYGLNRGLRYPPLQFDPKPRPLAWQSEAVRIEATGAYLMDDDSVPPKFRAFVPEPAFEIEWITAPDEAVRWKLENLHPEATVTGATDLGAGLLDRFIQLEPGEATAGQTASVTVAFPQRERYTFMAFGDAGGAGELAHCLQRAQQENVDFILHLGDVAYVETDFADGITNFGASPVPIYITPGNHDFHGGFRYRFNTFKEFYGPLNSYFELGGVRFLNLDTAADTVPAGGGQRGKTLAAAREAWSGSDAPVVVFTHRPCDDPRTFGHPNADPHALNRSGEAEWLRQVCIDLGAVLLAGHIHESHDFEHEGLRQIISGEGLGNRLPNPRLLIGEYAPGQPVEYRWVVRDPIQ